jgi:integrase
MVDSRRDSRSPSPSRTRRGPVDITEQFVASVKGTGHRETYYDRREPRFLLRVSADAVSRVFYCRYRDATGRRVPYRIGSHQQITAERARKRAAEILVDARRGADPAAEKRDAETLAEFLDGRYWRKHLSTRASGEAIKAAIRRAFPALLGKPLSSISSEAIETALADRRTATKRSRTSSGPRMAESTIRREYKALRTALRKAKRWGLIKADPCEQIELEELHVDQRKRFLQADDELKRFLAALATFDLMFQTLVLVLLNAGTRVGETLTLRWSDVNLAAGKLTLRGAATKAKKSREAVLNEAAVAALERWREARPGVGEAWVFPLPSDPSRPARRETIRRLWQRLVRAAKCPDLLLHDLRRSVGSWLVNADVPLAVVKDVLGHSSIKVTEKVYAHLLDERKRAAVAVLPTVVRKAE